LIDVNILHVAHQRPSRCRAEYRVALAEIKSNVWFADAPTHSVTTSRTPEEALPVLEWHVAYLAQHRHR
jgi:hypothetical protein